jgi:CHAD domain-containing protein
MDCFACWCPARMKGFIISNNESMAGNIHRILLEQLDYIIVQSESEGEDVHKAIHESRKSMKKIRAVLRMIRDEIGYSSYYRENIFYRDLSRNLSEIRNFEVLTCSVQTLQKDLSNTIPPDVFISLKEELDRQQEKLTGGPDRLFRLLKKTAGEIKIGRKRIYDFPIRHDDFRAFEGGLFRMYRQGKRYLRDARKNPSPTQLHNLRKRMKYFWHQMEILQPIFPGPMGAYASTLESIAENLGVYHDLQVLQDFLAGLEIIPDARVNEALQEACMARKFMLLNNTWPLLEIAYSEKPRAMVDRLANYWKVYAHSALTNTTHNINP